MRTRRGAAVIVLAAVASLSTAASAQLPTTTTSAPAETTSTTSCGIVGCILTTTTETSAPSTTSSTTTTEEPTTTTEAEVEASASGLGISAPGTVDLGTGAGTLQGTLGPVSVDVPGSLVPMSVTVTVTSTDFVGTNGGTVANDLVSYASGPALAGTTAVVVPGQLTTAMAQPLSGEVTALTGTGAVVSTTASWNPTIIVDVPTDLPAGDYHGTITHSAF